MSEPLKPCPFCGCEMNQQGYFVEGNHAYKCLFQDKAIRATTEEWNPRAEAAETREAALVACLREARAAIFAALQEVDNPMLKFGFPRTIRRIDALVDFVPGEKEEV